MKQILRAVLVSSLFASSAALAQDMEMNMNIQVDENGMPSTNIQMKGQDENGEEQNVNMRVRAGGNSANMQVKVKGSGMQPMQEQEQEQVHQQAPTRHRPPPPPPPVAARDCGTGNDAGCSMMRDGKYPMDAQTWAGFYESLKSQSNEISRQEMAEKMLKRTYITAAQYGLMLDLFRNEISRLELAKDSASHVVNPQHALGFSSKWRNSISAEEYSEMIAEQQP
ncbi:DUF4476 domain-containing protein [Hyalangium rubrum]|uniref:DUF4476 domain-containing protein n=1 Tax=Hyalangium rubrum TaxID=3103134 RepID=A0ABU5HHM3_9BACT|nr:DUF4476 domain-containing protein [Hyalangium sp. s54d21]MDY7231580.1 DUF4476 domain-containing protein [Hyalangium sp. s54d21]